MRNFKSIALIAALALTNVAFAETSVSTDYNNATMTVTSSGAYGEDVNFETASTALDLALVKLQPGTIYTVTIPVTNTTDRPITVSVAPGDMVKTGTGASYVTLAATTASLDLAAGGQGDLIFTVELAATATSGTVAGKNVVVTYTVKGVNND